MKAATFRKLFAFIPFTISIHAAREGGDSAIPINYKGSPEFQSTPPVKAATIAHMDHNCKGFNFNPRRP